MVRLCGKRALDHMHRQAKLVVLDDNHHTRSLQCLNPRRNFAIATNAVGCLVGSKLVLGFHDNAMYCSMWGLGVAVSFAPASGHRYLRKTSHNASYIDESAHVTARVLAPALPSSEAIYLWLHCRACAT